MCTNIHPITYEVWPKVNALKEKKNPLNAKSRITYVSKVPPTTRKLTTKC